MFFFISQISRREDLSMSYVNVSQSSWQHFISRNSQSGTTTTKYIYLNISTVHIGPADVGGSVPLAEEHVAPVGMHHNGAGPLQVAQQGASVVLVLGAQHVQRSLPKI